MLETNKSSFIGKWLIHWFSMGHQSFAGYIKPAWKKFLFRLWEFFRLGRRGDNDLVIQLIAGGGEVDS